MQGVVITGDSEGDGAVEVMELDEDDVLVAEAIGVAWGNMVVD